MRLVAADKPFVGAVAKVVSRGTAAITCMRETAPRGGPVALPAAAEAFARSLLLLRAPPFAPLGPPAGPLREGRSARHLAIGDAASWPGVPLEKIFCGASSSVASLRRPAPSAAPALCRQVF